MLNFANWSPRNNFCWNLNQSRYTVFQTNRMKISAKRWHSFILTAMCWTSPFICADWNIFYRHLRSWSIHLVLTQWGRATCMRETIIGSDYSQLPVRRQAIIWTSARLMLFGRLETHFGGIRTKSQQFSLKEVQLKCRLQNGSHFVSVSM